MPRSSTSVTVSSLQEYQSTIRSRFSRVTASTSTPRPRRSERAASGDCDEIRMSPLAPDFRPSARNVRAKRNFSWPGGPCSTTLEPAGRPPWTWRQIPKCPLPAAPCESRFQRPSQAAAVGQVRIHAHRVAKGGLEHALRRDFAEALGTHGPQVPMDFGDQFTQVVDASLRADDHLVEHGPPEFLMVRGQPVLHLRLDRGRAEGPDFLEEGLEVHHVEVDHFAERTGVVGKVDVEPEMRGPEAILERPRIVCLPLHEPEVRDALQELGSGRGVDVERPCDLAREMPIPVPKGPQDCEAVLPREEPDCLLEGLLVHGKNLPSERVRRNRSLCIVESGSS